MTPVGHRDTARQASAGVTVALLAALLTGCGGGGGDTGRATATGPATAGTVVSTPSALPPGVASAPAQPIQPTGACGNDGYWGSGNGGAAGRTSFLQSLGSFIAGCVGIEAGSGSYQVSGSASVASGIVADSDVNDPEASFAANNGPATAQPIPNPGMAIGFASLGGSGPAGSRFASAGDEWDTYRTGLAAGQVVEMEIGAWTSALASAIDLDLFLYDLSLNLVASSEGVGRTESLTVPASGTYYVVVGAYQGASTYTLSIGVRNGVARTSAGHWNRAADFVPGEAIASSDSAPDDGTMAHAAAAGASVKAGAATSALLLDLTASDVRRQAQAAPAGTDPWSGLPLSIDSIARRDTLARLKHLATRPGLASVGPNYRVQSFATANDTYYGLQWHYPAINLPSAWNITRGANASNPVIVAVIDTGVVLSHPDLAGRLVSGYDFISDPSISLDGDGVDANPNDPGDQGAGGTSSWHGTHVSGTVAATTNNGEGVAGVAGDARVMPVRVLGRGGGTTFDILQGILYASGQANVSGSVPAQAADVINLSLGGGGYVPQVQEAIRQARARGVVVVAAAGNETSSAPSYPAAYDGVISVSATDTGNALAYYSNFGGTIDVAAPGGDLRVDANADGYPDGILSTKMSESTGSASAAYAFEQGTSMAAPHVAGVVALMRAVNPSITPAQVDALITSGAIVDDLGPPGRDDSFGYGLINAYKAVVEAQNLTGTAPASPILAALPSRIDFDTTATQQVLRLENQGAGTITISGISDNATWLTIGAETAVNSGLEYRLSASRGGLASGVHSATITVSSTAGNLQIPVTLQVAGASVPGHAGRVYFLLLDPDTGENLGQVAANPQNGRYTFAFPSVPAGHYYLIGGSDQDNDGFICGSGESCGVWPASDLPEVLSIVNGDRSGLDLIMAPVNALGASNRPAAFRNAATGLPARRAPTD